MSPEEPEDSSPGELAGSQSLADALESDRFRTFLDHIPFAVAVSELRSQERIVYANPEFEHLTGVAGAALDGKPWNSLPDTIRATASDRPLSEVIVTNADYLGTFKMPQEQEAVADAWSNVIQDDAGLETFRLVALSKVGNRPSSEQQEEFEQQVLEKDMQLRELQHRVKNNLQMITALIRLEARNLPDPATGERFDKLAGRVEALALLYRTLSAEGSQDTVDLGVYVSQIASAVMAAHSVEGIHLTLQVDTWLVAVDVALPTGLVVNEVLTNALKHAFTDRAGGNITVKSLVDDAGCRVLIADDGNGLPVDAVWPAPGKMSALIVQSLRENAKADVRIESAPGLGTRVSIFFARKNAEPVPD